MFETPFVGFEPGDGSLDLRGSQILIDPDDYEGIHLAAVNLAGDLQKVTGSKSEICHHSVHSSSQSPPSPPREVIIVVGSLGRSRFISELVTRGTISVGTIQGKWESFQTSVRDCPWSLAKKMLVITGSDKRGTIFGVYTLSEQVGVSPYEFTSHPAPSTYLSIHSFLSSSSLDGPLANAHTLLYRWYWWADVPIASLSHVYALPVETSHGEPSVQYRGIFINDETPALVDWAREKFGPKLNAAFYEKVFELLLRLKANFLWPAMWSGFPEPGSIFFEDDPQNQKLADIYGIVVSTSHHEPMQRNMSEWRMSNAGEWKWDNNKTAVADFMRRGAERAHPFESILTLGMRGESDNEIDTTDPKATLTDVISTQRDIIEHVYGKPNGVTQVMALYKEVLQYYEDGLEVPGDVTLLFTDDNFGNIRRLPTSEERQRPGGIGIYYHLEYVGWPRSYKWLNANSCGKIQQQLLAAHASGAQKIWIFNVGDIKPQELPLTFALSLAWDIHSTTPINICKFFDAYAKQQFGLKFVADISKLLLGYDRMMALRRHEHIDINTFSLLNYREAETIVARWQELELEAKVVLKCLPVSHRAAFFQLVDHPIRASRINTELRVTQAQNQLYGLQRRNTTNRLMKKVLDLFDDDLSLAEEYHHSPWVGDKWNHIMKQPHYGFDPHVWHAPSRDMITGLSWVQQRQNSNLICGQMGIAVEGHTGVRPGLVNEESDRMRPSRGPLAEGLTLRPLSPYGPNNRFFEVYTRGTQTIDWISIVEVDWVHLSQASGHLSPNDEKDQRVEISIDWKKVPEDFHDVIAIDVRSVQGDYEKIHVEVANRKVPENVHGFVESDGHVAVDTGAVPLSKAQQLFYQLYPFVGRIHSGAVGLAYSVQLGPDIPRLLYPVFFFSSVPAVHVTLYFSMTLEYQGEEPLSFEILFDEATPKTANLLEYGRADLPAGWDDAVQDNIWTRTHSFSNISRGSHILAYRPLSRGLLLERIIIDLGGVQESYLGPPSSRFVGQLHND